MDLRASLKVDIDADISNKLAEYNLDDIVKKQREMSAMLEEFKALNDRPFQPDRSVVVYGYSAKEDESIDEQVDRLLYTVLGVACVPKFYERVTGKSTDKPGVLKIELKSVYDKIEILKAKKNCENFDDTKGVRIQTCDSHDSRVAKLNARTLLRLLPNDEDMIVTSHGLIKRKDARGEDANNAEGDEVGTTPVEETAHVAMSDNSKSRDHNKPNDGGNSRPQGSRGRGGARDDSGNGGRGRGKGGGTRGEATGRGGGRDDRGREAAGRGGGGERRSSRTRNQASAK